MSIKLTLFNKEGQIKKGKNDYDEEYDVLTKEGNGVAFLSTQDVKYEEGDYFEIEIDQENQYVVIQLDETLDPTLIYLTEDKWIYPIPLEHVGLSYSDVAFTNGKHYVYARKGKDYEIDRYQNLSINPHDYNSSKGAYPHATANVETRNDPTFFARNTIDGIYANTSHGPIPIILGELIDKQMQRLSLNLVEKFE